MDQLNNQDFAIFQCNGQRIFRPVDPSFLTSSLYEDVKNHEIFIDCLPNDVLEEDLLPFLCRIGQVLQIRFIMSFSGRTKGQAFVVFEEIGQAYRAVEELNGQFIKLEARPIKVRFSVNNRRLHIKNIPFNIEAGEVSNHLNLIGLINVKTFNSSDNNPFLKEAIISFESHQLASSARRLFEAGYITIQGSTLVAHWAKPKDFQTLFVSFEKAVDEQTIRNFFEGNNILIQKINYHRITKDGGLNVFIKYKTFEMANTVKKFYNGCHFPIPIGNGIYINKVAWPDRKSI